jgi:PTS system nitrogen regulatory IIA component
VRISNVLHKSLVIPTVEATDKAAALREIATFMCHNSAQIPYSPQAVYEAIAQRERHGSTGVGEGVAIPHAKLPELPGLVAAFGISRKGIPYEAIDREPARLIFMLLVPERSGGAHLKALARISRLLKNSVFREQLLSLDEASGIYEAFVQQDSTI